MADLVFVAERADVAGLNQRLFAFQCAIRQSRTVAGCRLICHLAAAIVARGRLPSLKVCLRWLPVAPRIRRSGSHRGYTLIATPLGN
jgi:hypothetical protein